MTVVEIEALEKGISNCHCWVGGPSPFLSFFHIHECGWKFWALSVEARSYCQAFHFEGHFGIAKDQTAVLVFSWCSDTKANCLARQYKGVGVRLN